MLPLITALSISEISVIIGFKLLHFYLSIPINVNMFFHKILHLKLTLVNYNVIIPLIL